MDKKNETKKQIQKEWDDISDRYYYKTYIINKDLIRLKEDPWWAFPTPVRKMLQSAFKSMNGLKVLVPSSGDNGAVFAFHMLGASVTSADISERHLDNAKKIAVDEGWDIRFIQADSMKLNGIPDNEFDLVYTSNGAHVWINDLSDMYANFNRVLKPDGRYIMFDTHPFNRPFDDSGLDIKAVKYYDDTAGNHWRVMDLYNAIIGRDFDVLRLDEFHAEPGSHDLWFYKTIQDAENDKNSKYDIKQNPFAALPAWIGFSAKKKKHDSEN